VPTIRDRACAGNIVLLVIQGGQASTLQDAHWGSFVPSAKRHGPEGGERNAFGTFAAFLFAHPTPTTMATKSNDKDNKEQDPVTPGPTTGGMRSMGPQPGEPTLEEKLGVKDEDPDALGKARRDEPMQKPGSVRQGPPPLPKDKAEYVVQPKEQEHKVKEQNDDKRPLRGS
jgi:hypothetical protein